MMGGFGGPGRMLNTEVQKPKNVLATIARFWPYFRPYWFAVALTLILITASAQLQVTAPELIGQAVDCYLFPRADACWYTTVNPAATITDRMGGLAGLTGWLLVIFIGGAFLQGLAFFSMNWTGQRALRQICEDVFAHIHRLSLGYFSRNEAGNVMSRITSDTDTIQQALSFALLSVVNGLLQIGLTINAMVQSNLPYALISLSVVPFMILATFYFSTQARRAFRASRQQMGNVNAGLQESIAGAREVQAFNREAESIAQFERANAANRDANIRAASFTSALNPVLEALGYVAIAIVVVVGALSALRNAPSSAQQSSRSAPFLRLSNMCNASTSPSSRSPRCGQTCRTRLPAASASLACSTYNPIWLMRRMRARYRRSRAGLCSITSGPNTNRASRYCAT